jgi:hypothetical protein
MIAIKKNPRATKCSNNCTICLVAHTAKIVVTILRKGKMRMCLEKTSWDLEGEKELRMQMER